MFFYVSEPLHILFQFPVILSLTPCILGSLFICGLLKSQKSNNQSIKSQNKYYLFNEYFPDKQFPLLTHIHKPTKIYSCKNSETSRYNSLIPLFPLHTSTLKYPSVF